MDCEICSYSIPDPVMRTCAACQEVLIKGADIEWLFHYKAFLDGIAEPRLVVYGSGCRAAWVGHILGDKVVMYIDDDVSRHGATFNGKPIVSPAWIAPGESVNKPLPVVAPFPDDILTKVKARHPEMKFL